MQQTKICSVISRSFIQSSDFSVFESIENADFIVIFTF